MTCEKRIQGKFEMLLVFVFVLSLFLFFFNTFSFTGYITEGNTTSNVTISKYLAITFGANLSEGIYFGDVVVLPATDVNATHNYDGALTGTTYTIDVSTDSNTAVDFCIKANQGLTTAGADVIGLGNETYSAYNATNFSLPPLAAQTSMTTGYVKVQTAGNNIGPGNSSYWRFWLDIPAAQPSGDYNNTVSFGGVTTGLSC
ncbi:MAG: hypothetical protein KKB62_00280 [Nanoarchaeota archaeon]|nr:hypothetical protein [Nanoarchaeota archaeon]